MDGNDSCLPGVAPLREFCTTHWSVVLAARDGGPTIAARAWECLCHGYWYPLYAYLRRSGHSPHDAQDLTQGFLLSLMVDRDLAGVAPARGKFRSFLLGTLKHFLADERKRDRAQKRGGGQAPVSIDEVAAESRFQVEPVDGMTPEDLFDRHWGLAVLDRAMERLKHRYAERGQAELFHVLQPCLAGSHQTVSYEALAAGRGMTEGSFKVAVHRLRKEFGSVLRAELGQIVGSDTEIDEELRQLIRLTAG